MGFMPYIHWMGNRFAALKLQENSKEIIPLTPFSGKVFDDVIPVLHRKITLSHNCGFKRRGWGNDIFASFKNPNAPCFLDEWNGLVPFLGNVLISWADASGFQIPSRLLIYIYNYTIHSCFFPLPIHWVCAIGQARNIIEESTVRSIFWICCLDKDGLSLPFVNMPVPSLFLVSQEVPSNWKIWSIGHWESGTHGNQCFLRSLQRNPAGQEWKKGFP